MNQENIWKLLQKGKRNEINVADIISCTEVEGPHKRFALWVQGCPRRCFGCCNPEMQEFVDRVWYTVGQLESLISPLRDQIEGVTFVGGEPVCQYIAVGKLARQVQKMGLGVLLFTGFNLEDLQEIAGKDKDMRRLLKHTDLVIDGLFQEERKSENRRYIGSDNQRVHFLSGRYRYYEGCWPPGDGAIEIRFDGKELVINGHPRPLFL